VNWVDVLVVVFLAFYAYRGWRRGFISIALGLLVFAASLGAAVLLYRPVGGLIKGFGVTEPAARAIAFFLLWVVIVAVGSILVGVRLRRVPKSTMTSRANRVAGILPGMVEGLILIAFLALLLVSWPGSGGLGDSVERSVVARPLIASAADVQRVASEAFGEAVQDALDLLIIEPKPTSTERIDLKYKTTDVTVDPKAEEMMLRLVNRERASSGLRPLVMDSKLRAVARAHSRDMFAKGYFSHVNLEGESPFKRMRKAGVRYTTAGENLALAPSVHTAHRGLMRSPGHRANILSPEFGRIGIGAVTSRVRGTAFSQEFAD
jgi:uncharacterized protein YkwD